MHYKGQKLQKELEFSVNSMDQGGQTDTATVAIP